MKSELRLGQHGILKGQSVVEVWHDGKFICSIYGADGPGVRIITKHHTTAHWDDPDVLEVRIAPGEPHHEVL